MLNDHDNTHAYTMTILEKKLDAKADLMMRKHDEIFSGSNWDKRPPPMGDSHHATDGDGAGSYAGAQPRSRTSFESNHR